MLRMAYAQGLYIVILQSFTRRKGQIVAVTVELCGAFLLFIIFSKNVSIILFILKFTEDELITGFSFSPSN